MRERRRLQRRKSYLGCAVETGDNAPLFAIVRNATLCGARLSFGKPIELPEEITVEIPKWECALAARIVWRDEFDIGVVFTEREMGGDIVAFAPRRFS